MKFIRNYREGMGIYMMQFLLVLSCMAWPAEGKGQTRITADSYIKSIRPTVAEGSTWDATNSRITTTYYDGLGREMNTVRQAASPTGNSLGESVTYDAGGREYRRYLPGVIQDVTTAYEAPYEAGEKRYWQTEYEASQLDR
ncbi:MAG: hypothetical protein IJ494_04620, partial [Bacteroides sp.]|nr:hypothetical protein [Bacteroides sp.]